MQGINREILASLRNLLLTKSQSAAPGKQADAPRIPVKQQAEEISPFRKAKKANPIPRSLFMGVKRAPQTEFGQEVLRRRQEEVKVGLTNVVISRLANGFPMKNLRPPLELLKTCSNPDQISPDLLLGANNSKLTKLETASKEFLVKSVIETTQRLWDTSIVEAPAAERKIVQNLQDLQAQGQTTEGIARLLCTHYGLPFDQFYSEQPPTAPKIHQGTGVQFIRF